MKDFNIAESVLEGEYNEPVNRQGLLEQAGNRLDGACTGDIVGDNLFLTDDGRLMSTSVEVVISDVSDTADENYSDQLEEARIINCSKCGKWHHEHKDCPTIEHKSLSPILVYVEGGLVQNIYTDRDVEVFLIDGDTEGGDPEDENYVTIDNDPVAETLFYASEYGTDPLAPLEETCDMKQILAAMYERDGVV